MIGSYCEAHGQVSCSICAFKGILHNPVVGRCLGCNQALGSCMCNMYKLSEEEWKKLNFGEVPDFIKLLNKDIELLDISNYLSKWFEFIPQEEVYKSKKKWRGVGTGDDKNLYIYFDERSTTIWWKDNRGFESTIFEGRKLEKIEEIKTVFDLLDLKIYGILN